MTLKVRVGRKGYVIIPKAVRELLGIREGDTLIVRAEEGRIVLEPETRVDVLELRKKLESHWATVKAHLRVEPKLGDLKGASLEEEFDDIP